MIPLYKIFIATLILYAIIFIITSTVSIIRYYKNKPKPDSEARIWSLLEWYFIGDDYEILCICNTFGIIIYGFIIIGVIIFLITKLL